MNVGARSLLFISGISLMVSSTAYELGGLHVESSVNEPLEASITLLGENVRESDPVIIDTASKIDFMRNKVKRGYYISDLKTAFEKNLAGQPVIKLTSDEPIMSQRMELLIMMMTTKEKTLGKYQFVLPQVRDVNDPPVLAMNSLSPANRQFAITSENTKSKAVDQEAGPIYTVQSGDSISRIAMKLKGQYPNYPSWKALMKVVVEENRGAFIHGNINQLKTAAVLTLPSPLKELARYATVDPQQGEESIDNVVLPSITQYLKPVQTRVKPYLPKEAEKTIEKKSVMADLKAIQALRYTIVDILKHDYQNDQSYHAQGVFNAVLL